MLQLPSKRPQRRESSTQSGTSEAELTRHVSPWLTVLLLWIAALPLHAGEIQAEVTYVAWKTLYLNAGRAHGIEQGLSGQLYREASIIGHISIAATAESTCVATVSGDSTIALLGDRVVILLPERSDAQDESNSAVSSGPARSPEQQTAQTLARKAPQFSGRLAVQCDAYDDRLDDRTAELLPGLSTRAAVHRIAGEGSKLSLRYRGRKLGDTARENWQHRLYTAELSFSPEHSQWKASFGRMQAGSVAGIGYIDGGYGEVALSNVFAVGLFGGAQAELDMSSTDLSTSKAGALVTYSSEFSATARSHATLALAGEYQEGQISREFIYQQFTFTSGGRVSFYESAEINVNRGWRQDAEGALITPANLLLNVRFVPARAIALNAGYDGRSRYHTWETRETPDSLFDDAVRHGMRAGAELMMLRGTRLAVQQSFRSDPSTEKFFPSGTYSLTSNSLLKGKLGAMLRYGHFENVYSTGVQQMIGVSVSPLRGFDLRSEYGETNYRFGPSGLTSESEWIRVSADVNLRTGSYFSVHSERALSTNSDGIRVFVELGHRIR